MMMAGRASFEADDASSGSTCSAAATTAAAAIEPASSGTTSLVVAASRSGPGLSGMFGQNSGGVVTEMPPQCLQRQRQHQRINIISIMTTSDDCVR